MVGAHARIHARSHAHARIRERRANNNRLCPINDESDNATPAVSTRETIPVPKRTTSRSSLAPTDSTDNRPPIHSLVHFTRHWTAAAPLIRGSLARSLARHSPPTNSVRHSTTTCTTLSLSLSLSLPPFSLSLSLSPSFFLLLRLLLLLSLSLPFSTAPH